MAIGMGCGPGRRIEIDPGALTPIAQAVFAMRLRDFAPSMAIGTSTGSRTEMDFAKATKKAFDLAGGFRGRSEGRFGVQRTER